MTTLPNWPLPAVRKAPGSGFEWIFEDPRSRTLLAEVEQVAPSEAAVLITGETGTGKELIARQIHQRSARRAGPFVTVSCGAFSEALVDAELFGHENGAFAGAFGAQAGWFEQAHGGTIFLDEVNDLPLSVQNKLLRVLQQRSVVRLGGHQSIPVDVRILAAATEDLDALIAQKRFRKDLYYRLNVVRLDVRTLHERPGDIVPLARYFIDGYSRRLGYPALSLTTEAERLLIEAPWPGNVRELENVIHRAMLLSDGREIDALSLRLSTRPSPAAVAGEPARPTQSAPPMGIDREDDAVRERLAAAIRALCDRRPPDLYQHVEDTLVREAFRYCHYSQSEAARLLGISRNIVRARLIRLGEIGRSRREPDDQATGAPTRREAEPPSGSSDAATSLHPLQRGLS